MTSKKIYKVLLHAQVPKECTALPADIRAKVMAIIESLSTHPFPPIASKLQGRQSCYRIRVGDYCLVYEVHATEVVVYVIGVAQRKEVYRVILRR